MIVCFTNWNKTHSRERRKTNICKNLHQTPIWAELEHFKPWDKKQRSEWFTGLDGKVRMSVNTGLVVIKCQDGETESKRASGQLQSWDKMIAVATENTAAGKAWRFPEWRGRWRYVPSRLTFLEMRQRAWRQTRKRRLIYRCFCRLRLLGREDEGQRSFVHGQMAPCLLKEEQRKNGDKRWSHRGTWPFYACEAWW